ncbi:MAG TPA: VOC family protein [Dehalococcoidia bacterium]
MKVNNFHIQITSENPDRLRRFYRDTVGLPTVPEMGEGAFSVGSANLFVDGHSEVSGAAKEPQRMLVDLVVDDVAAEQARLEGQGVSFIRREGKEEWGGTISTFLDPDGNYCQLVQYPQG